MSTSKTRFGLSVALATPFGPAGEIAGKELVEHARSCLSGGCDSVTLFGTTGEGASVGAVERGDILAQFGAAEITGERLVVGVSATAVEDAVRQIEAARAIGCPRVLLPPPYYFKEPPEEGVEAWYRAVIERRGAGSVGIILYNIPSQTAVPLSVGLIDRLRRATGDAIVGVKDSSGDWAYTRELLAAHRDIAILVGEERHLAAAVRAGGEGAICGMANLDPAALRRMAHEGEEVPAVNEMVELIMKYPLIPAIKSLIGHRRQASVWNGVRAPLAALSVEDARSLREAFDRLPDRKAA